ncbi:zinc finger protein JAGGED [Vigna angularis]|nr:zinc finger protein JAGGED [Vigna angularis]
MRPENNPLDLNNLPDDYSRDGIQLFQDSFSSEEYQRNKDIVKDDENEKVYECRFCSLKFCKSQALGGHMNRHRQERETETLNHARQLVYRNDHTLSTPPAPNLGCCQPIASGGYHPASSMGDPTMQARFPRYMSGPGSGSSSFHLPTPPPPQLQLHQPSHHLLLASPPTPPLPFPPPPSYSHHHHAVNDYYVGHVLGSSTKNHVLSDCTCIGAPVGQTLVGGGKDRSLQTPQGDTLNWGRGYSGTRQLLDTPSAINRCHEGFQ